MLLYRLLAELLAEKLEVSAKDLPDGGELNEVACRFLSGRPEEYSRLYLELKRVMPGDEELAIPEPLLQLAAIGPFELFITTSFDSLLQRALDEKRETKSRVYAFALKRGQDLAAPEDLDKVQKKLPVVYHLFGKLSGRPAEYVVNQEDTVEFIHTLQLENRRPSRLLEELRGRSLLILGSSFGGWLARFFLRAARSGRLLDNRRDATDYVADATISSDARLVLFLEQFSSAKEIWRGGAVEFVAELHRRWRERHPAAEDSDAEKSAQPVPFIKPIEGIKAGLVFLSYASEDREAVRKIKEVLEAEDVEVFFDREDIGPGDLFKKQLMSSIEECSLFVPIISQNALGKDKRFLYREWRKAIDTADSHSFDKPFLVPVVIDQTSPQTPGLPPLFRKTHWEIAPGGEFGPKSNFVDIVKQSFLDYQASLAGSK